MRTLNFLLLSILLFFYSCDQKSERKENDVVQKESVEINNMKLETIDVDSSIVRRYESLLDSARTFEKNIINKILLNIDNFGGKPFSNEYLTIGDIDGIGDQDTIKTTISVLYDTVHLKSKWWKDGHIIWENKLTNPYMWISEDNLFDYNSGDIWTRLTIAKDYSIPELSPKSKYAHIPIEMVCEIGLSEIKAKKKNVNEASYKKYIEDFNGELLEFGEPERRYLVIWYEPIKDFVTFYAP
jgi:hypothetical protein